MTEVTRLDEIRQAAGVVSILAARCQEDVARAVRLADGTVLAPTSSTLDMRRFALAKAELRDLLTA